MITLTDKECLDIKQEKTTESSKLKQLYGFKVREEHKQTKI